MCERNSASGLTRASHRWHQPLSPSARLRSQQVIFDSHPSRKSSQRHCKKFSGSRRRSADDDERELFYEAAVKEFSEHRRTIAIDRDKS
jgi:hypothetical protein